MRTLWRLTRFALGLLRWALRSGMVVVFVAMLALNVTTLVSDTINRAVSQMIEYATGRPTLAQGRTRQLRTSRADLARAQSDLKTTRGELDTSRRELAAARNDLDAERTARRTERDRARQAVRRQTAAISTRAQKAAVRNIGALPFEAIPFLGVPVNVASTAFEVFETCATMQAAHDLATTFAVADPNDPARMEACGFEVPTTSDVWAMICAGDPIPVPEGTPDLAPDPAAEPGWWTALLCRSEPPPETASRD